MQKSSCAAPLIEKLLCKALACTATISFWGLMLLSANYTDSEYVDYMTTE